MNEDLAMALLGSGEHPDTIHTCGSYWFFIVVSVLAGMLVFSSTGGSANEPNRGSGLDVAEYGHGERQAWERAKAEAADLNAKGAHLTHLTFDGRRKIGLFQAERDGAGNWLAVFVVNPQATGADADALTAACRAIDRAATQLEADQSPGRQGPARDLHIKLGKMMAAGLRRKLASLGADHGGC